MTDGGRTESFGQSKKPSPVDRFGVWLSSRKVSSAVGSFKDKRVGDFGSGYHATLMQHLLPQIGSGVIVDLALAEELKHDRGMTAIEGSLPEALEMIPDESLDVVLCISVLEHLWKPQEMLAEMWRVLAPGGTCFVNVPSWAGKRLLEFSAFKLGFSPAEEMEDHKTYYDPRDLWPLLVSAGFSPRNITCRRHKFGLNTFAACRK